MFELSAIRIRFPRRSHGNGHELTAYRRIAQQLHYDLPRPDGSRSVLLATPGDTPAAAQCSLTLATCLAQELGKDVALVDASTRKSKLGKLFDSDVGPGLCDVLHDPGLALGAAMRQTTEEHLSFLPLGSHAGAGVPLERIAAVLNCLQARHDFVVIWGGPILQNSLAMSMAPLVGVVLLSMVENVTTIENLHTARQSLELCKAQRVGLVLASSEDWK